jgi:hypothetical protein
MSEDLSKIAHAPSMNKPEAQDTRDNQKDCDDVIQELRHDQDEDARDQRDNRLKVSDAYGADSHFLIPSVRARLKREMELHGGNRSATSFAGWLPQMLPHAILTECFILCLF